MMLTGLAGLPGPLSDEHGQVAPFAVSLVFKFKFKFRLLGCWAAGLAASPED